MTTIRPSLLIPLLALALATPGLAAQDEAPAYSPEEIAMMEAWQKAMTPGDAHAALAVRAGSWTMTISSWMDPSAEPLTSEGTAEREMILGGRVLEERVSSEMMGQAFDGISRTGYDNVSGSYWSTWIDSMSTGVYVSHGEPDDSGAIVYRGEYADPMTGSNTRVRSVVHPEKDGVEIFEWYEDRGEGEQKTMEIRFQRAAGAE